MATACIPSSFVKQARECFGNHLTICTVIGFPLGYSTTKTKLEETKDAILNGADEIDMVVNLGWVKQGDFIAVQDEIQQIKEACGGRVLKVIVETCYLTEDEKKKLCLCVDQGGADYIKNSTGFGTYGAKEEDIELFKWCIGPKVKIKTSRGIQSLEDFELFSRLGCDRLGASSDQVVFNH